MPNNVAHFAIEADDLARARKFYESVFDWRITPWGPPDFFQIRTGSDVDPGIGGALQRRREPVSGTGNRCFECTISVESIDAITGKIKAHGGRVVTEPFVIVGVGTLIFFLDTEGNRVGAMHYDAHAGM
jgi:uncharacterized protein